MKTKTLIAGILFMFFSGMSVIAENADSIKMCQIPGEIKKALSLQMHFPTEARESNIEGVVATCFYITPEGQIKIYCINGHPVLTGYVKNKLESFECCPPAAAIANKHMFVRFNFEIEE